jgi:antitoxin component YwqK of YwqJK toxin-antitoxin module
MKGIPPACRIVSSCVAIALVTAGNPCARAERGAFQMLASLPSPLLSDVEPTEYAEIHAEPGIAGEVELVRERYPDAKVRIERQVTLNGDGNYVNHGSWKQYTPNGDVIAEGQYNFGRREGLWTKWYSRKDSAALNEFPFNKFKAPLQSQATFVNGKMDGEWIITDAEERKVMLVSLKGGMRNGPTTIWLPTGKIYQQITYLNAVPVGEMIELNSRTGKFETVATYEDGRKVITKSLNYPGSKQKKSEIMYLGAKEVEQSTDNFWTLRLAKFGTDGKNLRHGSAKAWFSNGQPKSDGYYQEGKKSGTFTFWHENGQVASTGEYRDDKPEGTWVWWHDNGQKSAVGTYQNGALIGDWRWWSEDGKLTKQQTYDGTESVTSQAEESFDVSTRPAKAKTAQR